MHPILFEFGRFKLHSYGLMVFLAFALGWWLAMRRGKREGINPAVISDLTLWIMVSGLLGARLTYVAGHLSEFKGRWLDIISPIQSDGTIGIAGLVILGGFISATGVGAWYLRRKGIAFLKMGDILAPSIAFGIAIGRIGCFLNGCCFGLPTNLPWGAHFPPDSLAGAVYPGVAIHPTQVYEFIYSSLIGLYLLYRTPRRKFMGELFLQLVILYGFFRFFNEIVRHYESRHQIVIWDDIHLTGSMMVSVVMVALGLYFSYKLRRKNGG
ncbi:MAG: prolipoprotein diacylglyceryl transferase [bacterium]